jgi:CTP:molybdopterin cytidylyltransferase MocA
MADVIVVLAAGASSRFGAPKQLASWEGRPLVRFVAEQALATGAHVFVVQGAHELGPALAGLPVSLVHSEHWQRGPGASLKALVQALPPGVSGVLVTLVDLPRVRTATYRALLDAPGALAAAAFSGTIGAPALFRGPHLAALGSLDDGSGAKALLMSHRADVVEVPCPEAAVDVDDPATFAAALQR